MARQPKAQKTPTSEPVVDQEKFSEAMDRMRTDEAATALALTEQNARVSALAQRLNYNGSTDLGVLENSAQDAIRRIGMAVFELGAYLLLLREGAAHGQFLPALERLKIEPRAAQRYMAVTSRFANASTSTHLEKAGFSRLVELLPLDDDQAEELTELGQTGELALDDVAGMSIKDLRAAVRKARQDSEKFKARAERQEAVNAELHEEVRQIKQLPPSEELKRTHSEAADIQAELVGHIQGSLRNALIALNNCDGDQSLHMAGMVGQLMAELRALRDEFNLPEVGDTPEWEKFAAAQTAASTVKSKAN